MTTCEHCGAEYDRCDPDHIRAGGVGHLPWLCRDVLRKRLAISDAAHLTTKRDASDAWTEHLSECSEQIGYERGQRDERERIRVIVREALIRGDSGTIVDRIDAERA
jgi:hypothetical protein